MFVRRKTVRGKAYFALVENQRVDGKVKQHTVASLGDSPDLLETITRLRRWAARETSHSENYKRGWVRRWRFRYRRERRLKAGYYNRREEAYWNPGSRSERIAENALVLCARDWAKEMEANQAKAAEYLHVAEAIENFAKRGITEEEWTTKRDDYLAAAEKAEADCWRDVVAQISGQRESCSTTPVVAQTVRGLTSCSTTHVVPPSGEVRP
jgi:hypothetical protein